MKKISTLLFAFLAGSLLLNAGPVPREKALDVASKLLAPEMTQTKSGDLELKIIAQDDAFYIIEQEGGGCVPCWDSPWKTISGWTICRIT